MTVVRSSVELQALFCWWRASQNCKKCHFSVYSKILNRNELIWCHQFKWLWISVSFWQYAFLISTKNIYWSMLSSLSNGVSISHKNKWICGPPLTLNFPRIAWYSTFPKGPSNTIPLKKSIFYWKCLFRIILALD